MILSNQQITADAARQLSPDALHAYQIAQAALVKGPYLGIAVTLAIIAVALILFRLPPIPSSVQPGNPRELGSAWHHRHLILGAGGIFLAVGAEVAIGSFLVSFLTQPDILGISAKKPQRWFHYTGADR